MSDINGISERTFEQLVRDALAGLPLEIEKALSEVAVVLSEEGEKNHAYGQFRGIGVKGQNLLRLGALTVGGAGPDQILIFRDTLSRDFGHDPALLAREVEMTVRHEVGHYLGFDEVGVQRLGL